MSQSKQSQTDLNKVKDEARYFQFAKILQNFELTGLPFVDQDFPASKVSLFRIAETKQHSRRHETNTYEERFAKTTALITEWQRPENLSRYHSEENQKWELIKDPKPSDICQGALGNCWFVAALAVIAEREELLSNIIVTSDVNAAGVYILRLFKDGVWEPIIIDSLLPCNSRHGLVFSRCKRKQLWVPLIEKAMAKLHGSYESLQSGTISDGLNYLTGFLSEHISFKSEDDKELLWGRLLSFHSSGFLMGANINMAESCDPNNVETKGLIANHEYSILQIVYEDGHRLIELKNPWGRHSWTGNWSCGSHLWNESMRRKLSPNKSDEGIFWMCYRDFLRYFTNMDVCKVKMKWKTYSFDGLLPPYADPDCQPCFEIICKRTTCEVDISIYQASKRNSREIVKHTDIGFMVIEVQFKTALKYPRFIQAVEVAKSEKRRCVTSNIMLNQGTYYIVPFSFGHWTQIESEDTYYPFALTIQSARKLNCSRVSSAENPFLLADAFICCAKKFGTVRRISAKNPGFESVAILSMDLGLGNCTVVENQSDKFVEFQMTSAINENFVPSRGSLEVFDIIPPKCSQVVQTLTVKDIHHRSRYTHSYRVQMSYYPQEHQKFGVGGNDKMQSPGLTDRIVGLHKPRPINDN